MAGSEKASDAPVPTTRRAEAIRPVLIGFVAALSAYLATGHGLFFYPYAGSLQNGAFIGLVVALALEAAPESASQALPAPAIAAVAALLGVGLGWLVAPPSLDRTWIAFAGLAVSAAAVGAGARWALDSGQLRRGIVFALALVLLLANLWATAAVRIQIPGPGNTTLAEQLANPPAPNTYQYDAQYYQVVAARMHAGQGYYAAVAASYPENTRWNAEPGSVFMVREPLLFWVWSQLPGWPKTPVWAFLAVVTAAVAVAATGLDGLVPGGFALIGAAAACAFALQYATNLDIFYHEVWAGFAGVLALGFMAFAARARGGRAVAFTAAAAAAAVLAFAMREIAVFALLAGAVSAIFAERDRRRATVAIWAAAWIAAVASWGAHALAASRIVRPGLNASWIGRGGLAWVFSALTEGRMYLGGYTAVWVMLLFSLAGLVGAFLLRERALKAFALVATISPLVFFVFAGNGAISTADQRVINYWGSIVAPMLLLLSGALALLLQPAAAPVAAAEPARQPAAEGSRS